VKISFLGCSIDNLTMAETLDRIEELVRSGRPHQHVVINVDKVVQAARDDTLRELINRCDLVNVDGMPIVWASRLLGHPLKERVTGADLFERLMERSARRGWRVYFLGGTTEVVRQAAETAVRRFPGISVAGWRDGYWRPEDEAAVAATIKSARPQLLFVAISSPKKEEFLARHRADMAVPFAMGIGGALDVFVGKVERAPSWMQRAGLEWLFRFFQEPRRMFRRYFINDVYFFPLLAREYLRKRRHP
jgi:N-acetylglucosaminyldiphosphoundecaprenol N-acetyl-beta-D-mannosaminyltransferase